MTNATKGQIVAFVNSVLVLVVAFGVNLTDAQTAAVTVVVNSALSMWIAFTYGNSAKRIPDA